MRARLLLLLGLSLGGLALGAAWSAPAAAQNRFNLVNSSGQMIDRVYVSPSRVNNWGPDMLGQAMLPPGQSFWMVPQRSDCLLDIRVVYQGGREETRWQVNACQISRVVWSGGGGGAPVASGGDPSFQFQNQGGATVNELYVSLSTERNWGPDRLGQAVLPPGRGIWVQLPAGRSCTVDIRVVYADGRASERRGVETCSIRQIAYR